MNFKTHDDEYHLEQRIAAIQAQEKIKSIAIPPKTYNNQQDFYIEVQTSDLLHKIPVPRIIFVEDLPGFDK